MGIECGWLHKGRYNIFLGRYLLTVLGKNLSIFKDAIEAVGGPLKGFTVLMIDFNMYEFKGLNTGKMKPEESFIHFYVHGVYEL